MSRTVTHMDPSNTTGNRMEDGVLPTHPIMIRDPRPLGPPLDDLRKFESAMRSAIVDDHTGKATEWSGFAVMTREGGSFRFSASIKAVIDGDPGKVKPYYQRIDVTGFQLMVVTGIVAEVQPNAIVPNAPQRIILVHRTQLEYKKLSSDEINAQIARLMSLLARPDTD